MNHRVPRIKELGDEEDPTVYVIVAQLLAFFRCLEEGLQPDSRQKEELSTA